MNFLLPAMLGDTPIVLLLTEVFPLQAHKLSIIVCGDFNSEPTGPAVQYMINRHVDKNDGLWSKGRATDISVGRACTVV